MKEQLTQEINTFLNALFEETTLPERRVYDAAKYTLMLPGKRIRPLITLLVLKGFGLNPLSFLAPACSIELIHSYSLIHDDLPCMDDDAMRRGKPSLHIAYDEATALLAGDLLLTHAFHLLATAPQLTDAQKITLITTLSTAAGGEGMIGGQMLDLLASSEKHPLEYLTQLHTRKTGALLGYAFAAGGIMAEKKETESLNQIGQTIGLAFQIIDDILDVTQTSEALGKPAKSDQKNNKRTFLSYASVDKAYDYAENLLQNAQNDLKQFFPVHPSLEALIDSLVHRVK